MAKIIDEPALTYDDVVILPVFSDIDSRKDINISSHLNTYKLDLPVVSANMDSVTEATMCRVMYDCGGIGILHRFASDNKVMSWMEELLEKEIPFGASIGVNRDDDHLLRFMIGKNISLICVDVAHGHHSKVRQRVKYIKNYGSGKSLTVAGNVCSYDGAKYLAEAGADIIKVGIGSGSLCTTRLSTGCGLPQLTAVMEVARIKSEFPDVTIIADGGIRNPGDVVKALAAGADAAMVGNLLAGTKASPGQIVSLGSFSKPSIYKHYRGSASMTCKVDNGQESRFIEGTNTLVSYRGKVETVLGPIEDGIRSGMSYVGARNISQLREKAVFVRVTNQGYREGTPHGATSIDY